VKQGRYYKSFNVLFINTGEQLVRPFEETFYTTYLDGAAKEQMVYGLPEDLALWLVNNINTSNKNEKVWLGKPDAIVD
jgi:hypothetical protein